MLPSQELPALLSFFSKLAAAIQLSRPSLSLLYGHLVAFQGTGQDSDKHTLYVSGSTRRHLVKFIQTKY